MENEKIARLNEMTEKFAEKIAAAVGTPEAQAIWNEYNAFLANFHRYSAINTMLIYVQHPGATLVKGFNSWKTLKRNVKKGEKGIGIYAPIINRAKTEDEQDRIFFKIVYVFDVSQTEGDDLPVTEPKWYATEKRDEMRTALIEFAKAKGVTVEIAGTESILGTAKGVSMGGKIVLGADSGEMTLIHEIAHEMLHQGDKRTSEPRTRAEREHEAELTAAIVGQAFGMDTSSAIAYLVNWKATAESIKKALNSVQKVANEIINAIEGTKGMEVGA